MDLVATFFTADGNIVFVFIIIVIAIILSHVVY